MCCKVIKPTQFLLNITVIMNSCSDSLIIPEVKNDKQKMKVLGEKWHSLSEAEKKIYERKAEEDLLRVQIQQAGLLKGSIESWERLTNVEKRKLHVRLLEMLTAQRRLPDMKGGFSCGLIELDSAHDMF